MTGKEGGFCLNESKGGCLDDTSKLGGVSGALV